MGICAIHTFDAPEFWHDPRKTAGRLRLGKVLKEHVHTDKDLDAEKPSPITSVYVRKCLSCPPASALSFHNPQIHCLTRIQPTCPPQLIFADQVGCSNVLPRCRDVLKAMALVQWRRGKC